MTVRALDMRTPAWIADAIQIKDDVPCSGFAPILAADLAARRHLGRFDTPRPLAQSIADWAIVSGKEDILEPSTGAGVFVHSALYRLGTLKIDRPHRRIWACDVDPLACQQTGAETGLPRDHLWNADFMSLATERGINGRRFDAIVGNPPFVSVHNMSPGQRDSARATADRLGISLDRKASLWAYFLVACGQALKPGGRLGLILPQAALHAGYAREVMHGIATRFARSMMISVREACFANVGTKERIIVFCGDSYGAPERVESGPALIECASVAQLRTFLQEASGSRFCTVPKLNGHAVPHLLSATVDDVVHLEQVTGSQPLEDFASIKIGAVTGANDFFVLREADRKRWKLPRSAVIPVISRFGANVGLRFGRPHWKRMRDTGERCWLLMPMVNESRASVLAYLASFDRGARDRNRTFAKRACWYRTTLPAVPDAFFKYMGSSGPHLVMSTFPCQCTNTTHALYFHAAISATTRRAVLLSLRSSYSRLSAEFEGRSYGADALKLEPSEAKRMRLILPTVLDPDHVRDLSSRVHALLVEGDEAGATRLVDDWLYESVPSLKRQLPRSRAAKLLTQARVRRRGAGILHAVVVR